MKVQKRQASITQGNFLTFSLISQYEAMKDEIPWCWLPLQYLPGCPFQKRDKPVKLPHTASLTVEAPENFPCRAQIHI